MTQTFNLGPHLQAFIGTDGVAELVFGPEGGMPFTDLQGHAELGTIWARLAAEPGVRAILMRSVGKGFCAGGTPDVVQGMLDNHAARLRVMREGPAIGRWRCSALPGRMPERGLRRSIRNARHNSRASEQRDTP